MARKRMPWFRLYVETFQDRKIRRLAPEHRWLWVAVLGAARESHEPGWLLVDVDDPMTVEDIADYAALPVEAVESGLTALAGLVAFDADRRAWWVPKFRERQFESDSSTERVAKHRAKKRGCNVTSTVASVVPETADGTVPPLLSVEQRTENREQTTDLSSSSFDPFSFAARVIARMKGNTKPGYVRGIERNLRSTRSRELTELVGQGGLVRGVAEFVGDSVTTRLEARDLGIPVPGDDA